MVLRDANGADLGVDAVQDDPAGGQLVDGSNSAATDSAQRLALLFSSGSLVVGLDQIQVPADRLRKVNTSAVEALARSISKIGLRHPITVRANYDGETAYKLVSGLHRLLAHRALGLTRIAASEPSVFTDLDARLWEIAENLHRAELTVQERSDHIAEWVKLTENKVLRQVDAKPEGGRPEGGVRAAARELGVTEPEARRSIKIAAISETAKEAVREAGLDDNQAALLAVAEAPTPELQAAKVAEIVDRKNGSRAVLASRVQPEGADYFPTPPVATRALLQRVFPHLGIEIRANESVSEPACGAGHMAEVLREASNNVTASDLYPYGYGDSGIDFLDETTVPSADLIITNPPFDKAEQFTLKALKHAKKGVAMFVRLQWLETVGRYERLFRDNPPTLIAFFAERIPIREGRWDPDGSTAMAYVWLVWIKGMTPQAPFWIPPGCKVELAQPDDRERFTAHPVRRPHDDSAALEEMKFLLANGQAASAEQAARLVAMTCPCEHSVDATTRRLARKYRFPHKTRGN